MFHIHLTFLGNDHLGNKRIEIEGFQVKNWIWFLGIEDHLPGCWEVLATLGGVDVNSRFATKTKKKLFGFLFDRSFLSPVFLLFLLFRLVLHLLACL